MIHRTATALALLASTLPVAAFAAPPAQVEVNRSAPAELTVRWASSDPVDVLVANRADADPAKATLVSARDRDGRHTIAGTAATAPRSYIVLRNARTGETTVAAERLVPLDGGSNFRDIGGYPAADGRHVRWGRIYRSGGQPLLTPVDLDRVKGLGLAHLVDLRSDEERVLAPTRIDGVAYTAIGYSMAHLNIAGGVEATYRNLPEMLAPHLREVFAKLLRSEQPLVYNCSAGQDRTGFVTAMVLSALGTPRETIIADYHLSTALRRPENEMPKITPEVAASNPVAAMFAHYQQGPQARPAPLKSADGTPFLAAALDEIEKKWGSVDAYLDKEAGVSAQDIARLRQLYTE